MNKSLGTILDKGKPDLRRESELVEVITVFDTSAEVRAPKK